MNTLRNLLNEAPAAFLRLTPRERSLVSVGGGVLFAFILWAVMSSFSASAKKHERAIETGLARLAEAQGLAGSFRAAQQKRQSLELQLTSQSIRLLSYVEEKGAAAGLQIPTINPLADQPLDDKLTESSVDLTLTDIKIDKLVNFLSSLETGPGIVKVKRVRIEPRVSSETLTAWVTISTYRMKQ